MSALNLIYTRTQALTLGVCVWLFFGLSACSHTDNNTQSTGIPPEKTKHIGFSFSSFTARKYTPEGALSGVFSGQTLTHFLDEKQYQLIAPKGTTQGKSVWEVQAERARASESLDSIEWQHNVTLTTKQSHPITLKTEQLNQSPNKGLFLGNKPVTFESNLGTINASGFTLNTQTEALDLLGDVRGHYNTTK